MLLDATAQHGSRSAGTAAAAPSAPSRRAERDDVLAELNQAVRRPEIFGGLPAVASLLDRLAAGEPGLGHVVWIPDTNARLAPSAFLRGLLPDADVCVAASQYGEDAHRHGWLRLDRTLTAAELAHVVDLARTWAHTDRELSDVLAEFGPPSVVFGSPDPDRPKTLSYAGDDREAPMVAFHFGRAEPVPGPDPAEEGADAPPDAAPACSTAPPDAVLLAVRVNDDFFGGWDFTPTGEDRSGD